MQSDYPEALGPLSPTTRAGAASKRLRRRQNLLRMAPHPRLAPDPRDAAVAVDQEGGALHAHVPNPKHALFDPHAVGFERALLLIGGERQIEAVLRPELVVARQAVRRHADHLSIAGRERVPQGVEILRLPGAPAGVVLGVEVKRDRPALEARQADSPAAGGGQR